MPSGTDEILDMSYEEKCRLQVETGQPLPTEYLAFDEGAGGAPPLDLVNVANSHTNEEKMGEEAGKRKPRGESGITVYGKRMVRNCADLMFKEYGKGRVSFLTLTLPDMEVNLREKANIEWPEMIRQFLQWLARRLSRQGCPLRVVGVTEIQPGRTKSSGHRWLHYHACFVGAVKKYSWVIKPCEVREAWTRIVQRRVKGFKGECPGENLKAVNNSAGSYLSKYMSKGGLNDGTGALPSAWWNASAEMREEVRRNTRRGEGAGMWLEAVIDTYLQDGGSPFLWIRPITLWSEDGYGFLIGWTGRLKAEAMP